MTTHDIRPADVRDTDIHDTDIHDTRPASDTRRETLRSRRGFLATVGVATVGLTALTAGQSVGLLDPINLFGPRTARSAPQGLPVNRTAKGAGIESTALDPAWRLMVAGAATLALGRDELLALPQTEVTLPIACVEGWSVGAHWIGVRISDLMARAGASPSAQVRITSLEPRGVYRITQMGPEFIRADTTLVALKLNGADLSLDHGYPARIIAPNRPGVLQTKWLTKLEVV